GRAERRVRSRAGREDPGGSPPAPYLAEDRAKRSHMRKIEIEIGGQFVENPEEYLPGVVGAATLLDDLAPRTCEALWSMLPIETRTIHTYRLGQTWRTETNHRLTPTGHAEEHVGPEQTR